MRIDQDAIHRVMMSQCDEGSPDTVYQRLNFDSVPLIAEFQEVYGPIGGLIVGFIGVGVDLGIEVERSRSKASHPDPETDHGHEDEFLESLPEAHSFGMGI